MLDGALLAVNFALDLLCGVGILYLLLTAERAMRDHYFFCTTVAGLALYVVAEPLTLWYPRWLTHGVHGLGLLCIAVGVARPVLRAIHDDDWATLLVTDPDAVRPRPDWMTPMDDDILTLFNATDLTLSPALIADNIGYSREEVNRRLIELTSHGLVTRVDRGKYELTSRGETYFYGGHDATGSDGQSSAEPGVRS